MQPLEYIQSVFRASPTACLILYPDVPHFTIAWANDAFLNIADRNSSISGKSIFDAFQYSNSRKPVETALEKAVHQQKVSRLKFQKDGLPYDDSGKCTVEYWDCDIYPVLDSHNQVQFIVQSFVDVTNTLKQTAADLDKGRKEVYYYHVSNILETITDCFFAVDRDWTVTYWNSEAERISGMPRYEIVGKNLWDVYAGAVTKKFYTEYHRAMSDNVSVRFEEYAPALKIWIEAAAFPSDDGLLVYFKDITQRKTNEEQIEKERQKYQSLFNSSPLPMWVYDAKTLRFLDVNDAAIKHYGYTREEFLAISIKEIRPKEDVPKLTSILKNIKIGHINKSAVRHIKKTGEIIFVDIESDAIAFEGKNARIVTAADITEKLAAEQALEANEKRFRALIQGSSDLVSIHDKLGNYLYVSPACKSVIGIDAEFYIGKNAFDFVHEDDLENARRQFCRLGTRKRVKISPFRFKTKDNEFRWMETILTDMTDDPAVGGIVSNSRDVTQRIENELMIKESIERFNIVSKATSDTIWDWDIQSGHLKWNQGIKGIFGYKDPPDKQILGLSYVHPDDRDRVLNGFRSLIESKKSRMTLEYRFRCADGTYKYVLDRAFLLFNKEGKAVRMIGAMQDITGQVNHILAIEEQNKRLQEISWIQSHIVRAPLARIMGLSKTLSDNFQDEKVIKELLPHLNKSADELDIIIRDIVSKTSTD